MTKEKLTTINKAYILKELRDGFDEVQRGSLKLKMASRTGNKYTNFTNRCEIVKTFKNSKYKVGDVVWVHYLVSDQLAYDDYLFAGERQIWFKAENIKDVQDEDIVVFKYDLHEETTRPSGIVLISYDEGNSDKYGLRGKVVGGGGLEKGSQIYFNKDRENEVWQDEEQYLVIEKKNVCMVDGKLFGDWYYAEPVDITDMYLKHKIRLPKGGVIALLKNPLLAYDGVHVVLRKLSSPYFVSPREILAIVDLPSAVSPSSHSIA